MRCVLLTGRLLKGLFGLPTLLYRLLFAPKNDHDDRKRLYSSKAAADRVVARMRSQGVPGAERLNSYFNEERDGWFVGRRGIMYQ